MQYRFLRQAEMAQSLFHGLIQMMKDQHQANEENDERDRRAANIFLLVAAVIIVGGGIWLVNAMIDAKKSEECFESGRRNCNPISVPER
jgi:cytoskeletal protein RodZ